MIKYAQDDNRLYQEEKDLATARSVCPHSLCEIFTHPKKCPSHGKIEDEKSRPTMLFNKQTCLASEVATIFDVAIERNIKT